MRIVQLLGTNGAGKSSIFRALAESDPRARAHEAGLVTCLPTYRAILVGNYLRGINTPGVDALRGGKAGILQALDVAVHVAHASPRAAKLTWIGWEGIIILTRMYHQELLARNLEPVYLVVDTPEAECFARIEGRSGKRRADLKGHGKIVVGRARGVVSLAKWLGEQPGSYVTALDGRRSPHVNSTLILRMLGVAVRRTPVLA